MPGILPYRLSERWGADVVYWSLLLIIAIGLVVWLAVRLARRVKPSTTPTMTMVSTPRNAAKHDGDGQTVENSAVGQPEIGG